VDSRHLSQMDMAEAQSLNGVRTIEEFLGHSPLVVDASYRIPSDVR
jgi:hypothetical protein